MLDMIPKKHLGKVRQGFTIINKRRKKVYDGAIFVKYGFYVDDGGNIKVEDFVGDFEFIEVKIDVDSFDRNSLSALKNIGWDYFDGDYVDKVYYLWCARGWDEVTEVTNA